MHFRKSLLIALKAIFRRYNYLVCLFYAIFRLADFSSQPFDFRLQKRNKEVTPSLHKVLLEPFSPLVFKYATNRNCFGDLTYGVKSGSYETGILDSLLRQSNGS